MGSVRYKVKRINGTDIVEEIHKVVVHYFTISDTDDPELYAAEPIWKWQQSDPGKYVMEHAEEQPVFHKYHDYASFGYRYAITAELEKKKLSEFYLKWGKPNGNH